MTLSYTYDGGALAHNIAPTGIALPTRAEMGEASFGGIPIEDPGASLTTLGHRPFLVEDNECAQPRLWTGYVTERGIGRSLDRGMFVGPNARLHDMTIIDCNAIFDFRLISGADGKRPEETWDQRLAWILGSDYMDGLFGGDTTFIDAHPNPMDSADYRGGAPSAVFGDLVNRFDGAMNFFAFWSPATAAVEIAVFGIDDVIGACTLRISNVFADVDSVTTFAPDSVAELARAPDQVYSEVIVDYANGSIFRSRESTERTHIRRGTRISRPYTGKASTAQAQAEQWLTSHAQERDRISCTIQVPATSVGLVRAGMSIDVKLSHTDYAAFTTMRIAMCSPVPTNDVGDFYNVSLELVSGMSVESCSCLETTPVLSTGLQPVTNRGVQIGPIYIPAYCSLTVDRYDWTGYDGGSHPDQPDGYRIGCYWSDVEDNIPPHPGSIRITFGQPLGTRVESAFEGNGINNDPSEGTIFPHGTFSGLSGEVFTNPTGEDKAIYLQCASDPYFGSEGTWSIAATYHCGPGGPEDVQVDLGNYPGEVVSATSDPTAPDDSAHGYAIGQIWVNTATGEAFILVDATPGAAVWVSITATDAAAVHEHVWQEDHSANCDDAEDAFATTYPVASGTTMVWLNGLLQQPDVDYTEDVDLAGITFAIPPLAGDVLTIAYILGAGATPPPPPPPPPPPTGVSGAYTTGSHAVLLKLQTHDHTNASDGSYTAATIVGYYAGAGYDALAITDHDEVTAQPGGIASAIAGNEFTPSSAHMTGLNSDYTRGSVTNLQAIIDAVVADGGQVIMNHPNYSTGITYLELAALADYMGIEVFNGHCEDLSPASYPGWAIDVWDNLLTNHDTGTWGFASDDFHGTASRRGYDVGRTLVWAASNTVNNIMAALAAGNFVADVGNFGVTPGWPTLTSDDVSVTCAGAVRIEAYGAAGTLLDAADADNLTYALVGDEQYVRLEVVGDYTESFGSAIDQANRWGAEGGGTWAVADGILSQTSASDVIRLLFLKRHLYRDWEAACDVRLDSGSYNKSAGLIFALAKTQYYARLSVGEGLRLYYGLTTILAEQSGTVTADTWYRIRMTYEKSSATFRVKYWAVGDSEPGSWGIEVVNGAFSRGIIGLKVRGAHDFDNLYVKGYRTFYQPITVET